MRPGMRYSWMMLWGFYLLVAAGVMPLVAAAGPPTRPALAVNSSGTPLIAILCYHHLSNDPRGRLETVSPDFLRSQIRASKAAGWRFMALSELLSYKDRPEALPPRVMVLTFDDGYRSFIEHGLPILREEGIKATLSIITSFVDLPPADLPPLMSWDEIGELDRSGQVEIASHSHDLHRYVTCNPYRDTEPSVATRRYLLEQARYEDRGEYRDRIAADLRESQRLLTSRLGHDVSVLTWPYGDHNRVATSLAAEAGFTTALALGWREVRLEDLRGGCLPRIMVTRGMNFKGSQLGWLRAPRGAVRAARVDLDDLYDPDDGIFRRRVDQMVSRVRRAGASDVFLQGCTEYGAGGRPGRTYFMNHQTAVRADIWSMVASKLAHARVKVWIRAPSVDLPWAWGRHPEWRMARGNRVAGAGGRYRVSPDLPEVRRAAIDFYTDLAVYLPIEGVLFDEDASILPDESLRRSPTAGPAAKADATRGLLQDLEAAVRAWRPDCEFGRVIPAPIVDRTGAPAGFSQDYELSLRDHDLTVLRAPARSVLRWTVPGPRVGELARFAVKRWSPPPGRGPEPAPVMIELQACDASRRRWAAGKELRAMAREARAAGVVHLGVACVTADLGDIPERLLEGRASNDQAAAIPGHKR